MPGYTRPWGYSTTTGSNNTRFESTAGAIGFINLQVKLAGKPGTGKPYAGFDEAGVGNVTKGAGLRPMAKALAKPPDPTVGAPIPDPTAYLAWASVVRMISDIGDRGTPG